MKLQEQIKQALFRKAMSLVSEERKREAAKIFEDTPKLGSFEPRQQGQSYTPISTTDVKRNPFAIAATNSGYKLAGSYKTGKVQQHDFHNAAGQNLHLVNHGSDFWTAHVDGKQFRLSPGGADEVQQFNEYLRKRPHTGNPVHEGKMPDFLKKKFAAKDEGKGKSKKDDEDESDEDTKDGDKKPAKKGKGGMPAGLAKYQFKKKGVKESVITEGKADWRVKGWAEEYAGATFEWTTGKHKGMSFDMDQGGHELAGTDPHVRGGYEGHPEFGDIRSDTHQLASLLDDIVSGKVKVKLHGEDVTATAKRDAARLSNYLEDSSEGEEIDESKSWGDSIVKAPILQKLLPGDDDDEEGGDNKTKLAGLADEGEETAEVVEDHIGFDELKGKLEGKKGVYDAGGLAAAIGNKKYGKKAMQKAAKKHEPLG